MNQKDKQNLEDQISLINTIINNLCDAQINMELTINDLQKKIERLSLKDSEEATSGFASIGLSACEDDIRGS